MVKAIDVLIELEKSLGYYRDEEISIYEFKRIVKNEKLSDGVMIIKNPSKTNITGLFAISKETNNKYKTIITVGEKASKEEKIFNTEGQALNYLLYRLRLKKQRDIREQNFDNSAQRNYRF